MPPPPAPQPMALRGVSRSLFIPLIARAQAAAWCPRLDPQDARARQLLIASGERPQDYPSDYPTAINILWRTCAIKAMAHRFFAQHTAALGANLGAGLSDYFQWLDNGSNQWMDVDLPEVIDQRRQLMPPRCGPAVRDGLQPAPERLVATPGPASPQRSLAACVRRRPDVHDGAGSGGLLSGSG